VCDLETSRIGVPYIYDISRLRVNTVQERIGVCSANKTHMHYVNKVRCL